MPETSRRHRLSILLVENDKKQSDFITQLFSEKLYRVQSVGTGKIALQFLENGWQTDILIISHKLPEISGLEILKVIDTSQYAIVFLTNEESISLVVEAMKLGALDFLPPGTNLALELPFMIEKVYQLQKNKQEKYRLEAQLALVMQTVGEGIIGIDTQGEINFANDAAARILNCPKQNLLKTKISTFIRGKFYSSRIYQSLIEKSSFKMVEEEFLRSNLSIFPAEYSCQVIYEKEQMTGLVISFRDVSQRHETERELKKSEQNLRELNFTKDKFFSIIAHDLRSPFSNIIGVSKMLQENIDDYDLPKIKRLAKIISDSSNSAYRLLENLLEWTRVHTGRIQSKPDRINLNRLVFSILFLFESSINEKNLRAKQSIPENLYVYADPNMLATIIRNLVSNAIKFTFRNGSFEIRAEAEARQVRLEIQDTGIGISPKNIEKLFKIEGAYSSKGTDNEKGTGLGLILCKEFVEKNNGKIGVRSTKGKGSIFWFTVPIYLG